jgi:PAS domain S-box-containing protein
MPVEEVPEDVSVITCDAEGVVQTYSQGAQRLFGWKPEEVIGKQRVALFHRQDVVATLVPRLLKAAAEEGKFQEVVTLVRKDGGEFRGLLTVFPMYRDGLIVGYMGRTEKVE